MESYLGAQAGHPDSGPKGKRNNDDQDSGVCVPGYNIEHRE